MQPQRSKSNCERRSCTLGTQQLHAITFVQGIESCAHVPGWWKILPTDLANCSGSARIVNPGPRLGFEGRLMANPLLHALGEKWLDVENTTSLKGQMILELRSVKRMKRKANLWRRLCGENELSFPGKR